MFDIGWSELLLIAILAIVFVGPKDLPRMMRTVGQYVAKARAMAREFQKSFDELARETELDELRKEVNLLRQEASAPLRKLLEPENQPSSAKPVSTAIKPDATEQQVIEPMDTSGLSPEMADSIREAEAVTSYEADEKSVTPATDDKVATAPKQGIE